MSRAALIVAVLAAVLATMVAAGAVREPGWGSQHAARGKLVLNEEFRGTRLDRSLWSTCHWWRSRGCTIASNGELEAYVPGQVRVRRGQLRLTASRRPVRGQGGLTYPYRSGMISTGPRSNGRGPKFSFKYGRAEMRAKIPVGRGLWPAFWLLPVDRRSRPEIDVMEIYGHDPGRLGMHFHWLDSSGAKRDRGKAYRNRRLAAGWHRFAIDWRPGRLTWLVDGVERWRFTGSAVPRERMYLIANLAVGGYRAGSPTPSTRLPASLRIDHIKVWR